MDTFAEYLLKRRLVKSEEPITEPPALDYDPFEVPLNKAEIIPSRYLDFERGNPDDLKPFNGVAERQMGFGYSLKKNIEAARFLVNGTELSLSKAIRFYKEADEDVERAALAAYNLEPTNENLYALRQTVESGTLLKQETVDVYKIVPGTPDATDVAEAVQRSVDNGYINPVKLNGKHSKGSMVAKEPQTGRLYLLKPGSGKNSPAAGVDEDFSTQSEREAAFWHVADSVGISHTYPRADLILVNGHQTAVMQLLPTDYRNLGEVKKQDPNIASRVLDPYLRNGLLFKWAALDWVLGNPDRHSQNIMIDPKGKAVYMIDHGSSMAGESFDPASDDNSFIPYYLRAWTTRPFTKMDAKERVQFMPTLPAQQDKAFSEWLAHIDEGHVSRILQEYHVNPDPALRRLAMLRMAEGSKSRALVKLWAGLQ
jgi:hypothetical protein